MRVTTRATTASPRTLTADAQLMRDYLSTAGILVNPDGAPAVAAIQNENGEDEAIVIDVNGHVCHVCREPLSDSGWNMFGLGAGFGAIAAVDSASVWALGRLDASFWQGSHGRWTSASGLLASGQAASDISVGSDGTVWAVDFSGAAYVKGASTSQGAPPLSASVAPAAARDAAGWLHVFCIDASGNLWTIGQEAPSGGWGNWTALAAPANVALAALAAAPTPSNGLDVFALAAGGAAVWCIGQPGPGQPWSTWGSIGAPAGATLGTMTFALNSSAQPEVFASDTTGQIWHNDQSLPGGGWTGWQSLGTPGLVAIDQLTVTAAANGALVLFVSGAGLEPLASIAQTGPAGAWGAWSSLGSEIMAGKISASAVGLNQNGCLDVFALVNLEGEPVETGVWHCTQQTPNGSWGGWTSLGAPGDGMQLGPIAVGQNGDGRLELFATGSDGALWHCWQNAPGSDWSGWNSLAAPGSAPLGQVAVTRSQTGCLHVFGLDSTPTLSLIQQMAANNGWSAWVAAWWAWCPLGNAVPLAHAPSGRGGDCWAVTGSGGLAQWSAGAWTSVTAPAAAWISACADGTVWLMAADGVVYRYVNGAFQPTPGSLLGVATFSASDGTALWATAAPDSADSDAYSLFRYGNGSWHTVETPPLHGGWNPPRVSAAADGSVWVLDGSGATWRMQPSSPVQWTAPSAPVPEGYVASLTAAPASSAWAVDSAGGIWRYRGFWMAFEAALPDGATPQQVASGAAGTVWAIDSAGNPYEYVGTSAAWQPVAGLPPLTVAPTTWALGKNGTIWQYTGGAWTQLMHSLPNSIWPAQVVAAADSVWALDIHGGLYQFSAAQSAWETVAGAPAGLVQVAVVNAANMWGIAQDASDAGAFILYCCVDGAWQLVAGAPLMTRVNVAPQVSAGPDGTVWVLDGSGTVRLVRWNGTASTWTARKAALALQSIAATGVDDAWAVAADGSFRRNFGSRWIDAEAPLPLGAPATSVSIGSDGTTWALDLSGGLYVLGEPNVPAPPAFGNTGGPAACLDGAGNLELFTTDNAGALWACREGGAGGWWQGWLSLGSPAGESVAGAVAGLDAQGRVQAFAIGIGAGALWQRRQTAAGGGWGPWASLGAPSGIGLTSLAIAPNQDGRLQIFAIGSDDNLYTAWETAPGVWSGWGVLSPAVVPLASLTAALRSNGTLEVVALGTDQAVHWIAQTAPNDGWTAWAGIGAPAGIQIESIAVAPNANGLLQVFAVGSDTNLYTSWEAAPGVWSAWGFLIAPPGNLLVESVAAGLDAQGYLHVLAVDPDRNVHHVAQTAPSNGWGAWQTLGPPASDESINPLLIVTSGGGTLVAMAGVESDATTIWTMEQDDSSTGWSTWIPLASAEPLRWSPVPGAPPLVQPPSGSASDSWAVTSAAAIAIWNGQQWIPMPLPGGAAAGGVSVGTDGSVWAVTAASGQSAAVYQYANGGWQQAGSGDFAQAPVGSAIDLWCRTAAGAIWRSADGGNTWWEDTGLAPAASGLAAGADGTVWALDVNGTPWISPAWQRTVRPTGMGGWPDAAGTAVAAGRDSNGLRYAFFIGANDELAYSFEVFRHTWIEPLVLASQGISRLGVTNQYDSGALIAYGTSGTSLLVASRAQGAGFYLTTSEIATFAWNPVLTIPTSVLDAELCAVDANTWYWLGLASIGFPSERCLVGASSTAQSGTVTLSYAIDAQTDSLLSGLAAIVKLPWPRPSPSPYVTILDGNQNLQIIAASAESFGEEALSCATLALTGQVSALPTGVTAIAASWQARAGLPAEARFYATAPVTAGGAPALWVARVIDASQPVTEPAAWSNWVPLGGSYLSLATGPVGRSASTVFGTSGSDTSLTSLSQDPVTGKWTALEVKRPSEAGDAIEQVTMYHTLITLGDASGTIPQTGVPVTITAASPVVIWVASGVHLVDAAEGITCPTDATGSLRIRTLATGLHTPQLSFAADALPAGQSVYPPQHVHDFLAGSGQLPVGGGMPASFTAGTLVAATVGGQPLSPSLTQSVAQQTVTWAGQITQMPSGASASPSGPAGWAIDLADRSRPVIHAFEDAASLRGYREGLRGRGTAPPGSFWDHVWHGITHAADDVVHAVENGAVAVDTIVVDTASNVVSLSLSIAGAAVGVFDMVVNTVEDAMRAIEALLNTLVADIELIIEWLELLFEWEDIWQTKEMLEQFLGQAFALLAGEIGTAESQIQNLVTTLESALATYFDGLISALGSPTYPYQTFGDLPTSSAGATRAPAGPGPASAPGSLPPVPGSGPVHYLWLLAKTLDNITPSFGLGSLGSLSLTSLLDAIDVDNVLEAVEQAVTDLVTYLTSAITDPSSFRNLTIVAFLEAARDLLFALLDALEDLLDAFLDVVQQVIAAIGGVFNHRLDIPVISSLYRFVTGLLGHPEDLTVLHLCALLIAVPLTITYKLMNGGQTPYSGSSSDDLRGTAAAPGVGTLPASDWTAAFMCVGIFIIAPVSAIVDGIVIAQGPEGGDFEWRVPFLGAIGIVAAMIQQINSWPNGFPTPIEPTTEVAGWAVGNWGVYWVALLVDLAFTVALVKHNPAIGMVKNIVRTDFGLLALATAAVAIGFAEAASPPAINGAGIAQDVVKPMPFALSWMLVGPIRQAIFAATDGFDPAIAKLVADALCDVTLPFIHEYV